MSLAQRYEELERLPQQGLLSTLTAKSSCLRPKGLAI